MKKGWAVFIVALCLGLSACGSGNKSAPAPAEGAYSLAAEQEPAASEVTISVPTPSPTVAVPSTPAATQEYALTTYFQSIDYGEGYSCDATLKVGAWVKASDSDAIQRAWEAVGGKGSVPDCSQYRTNAWQTAHYFETKTSIMFFGSISVKDTTPGDFTISDSAVTHSISLGVDKNLERTFEDSYVEYSNSGKFRHSDGEVNYWTIVSVSPNMKSDSWGPVPFVVCFGGAFTPEYPDGRPEIYEALWKFGSENNFNIYPSWTDDVPTSSN